VTIRRLVVDILKPHETSIIDFSQALAQVEGIEEVDVIVTEVDAKTETVRVTLRGSHISYEAMSKMLSDHGVTLRSIDEINVVRKSTVASK